MSTNRVKAIGAIAEAPLALAKNFRGRVEAPDQRPDSISHPFDRSANVWIRTRIIAHPPYSEVYAGWQASSTFPRTTHLRQLQEVPDVPTVRRRSTDPAGPAAGATCPILSARTSPADAPDRRVTSRQVRRLYDDPMEAGQQVHNEQLHSHPLCRFRACRQPDLYACVGDADRQIWRAWFALIAHGGRWHGALVEQRAHERRAVTPWSLPTDTTCRLSGRCVGMPMTDPGRPRAQASTGMCPSCESNVYWS